MPTTPEEIEGSAYDAEPTTHDHLIELPSKKLHSDAVVVEAPDCAGTIDEHGDCVGAGLIYNSGRQILVTESSDLSHRVKVLSGEDNCPDGYVLNPQTRICEDIDECSYNAPCDYECINLEGGYDCKCPPGYELTEDGCYGNQKLWRKLYWAPFQTSMSATRSDVRQERLVSISSEAMNASMIHVQQTTLSLMIGTVNRRVRTAPCCQFKFICWPYQADFHVSFLFWMSVNFKFRLPHCHPNCLRQNWKSLEWHHVCYLGLQGNNVQRYVFL